MVAIAFLSLAAIPDLISAWPAWLRSAPPRPRPRLDVGPLLTLPPPATPFPCTMNVWQGGTLVGEDVGIVTFVDGWLHFEGYRTNFALGSANVVRVRNDRFWLVSGGELVLRPDDALIAEDWVRTGLQARFRQEVVLWKVSESPDGPPLLPPMNVDASAFALIRDRLLIEAILGIPSGYLAYAFFRIEGLGGLLFLAVPLSGIVANFVRWELTFSKLRTQGKRSLVE